MAETLFASFGDPLMAERAVGALLDYGANHQDISLVAHETYGERRGRETDVDAVDPRPAGSEARSPDDRGSDRGRVSGLDAEGVDSGDFGEELDEDDDPVDVARFGISTTTPADAASGAMKGAGIGLGVGALAALAALLVPGYGLVLGGGALATALAGAAGATAAGALAGGVTGYLKEQGVPEHAAGEYHETIQGGGAMIAIRLPSGDVDRATAEQVLAKYQASNVGTYETGAPA
jgi:hypothetical protein